ncbi:hypothetical protein [Tannerella forsythia]|uniref:Uncharacterized protein n=1 Tax=Tannerella forsythia TaxID=28112 RepID=A0A3P1YS67_TANFO|nr:hypothetical protein [Tannerella forsythia]RRD56369.1 hypothetical protein EII40_13790 [Tannerella forsythia]RRD72666.1 hypothetical protein EII41_10780 [Tannerella forsythia]
MGQRTTLNIVTAEQTDWLFEGNNSLPYFWLLLLDRTVVEAVKPQWNSCEAQWNDEDDENEDQEDYFDEEDEEENGEYPAPFRLTPAQFRQNAERGRIFLMANSPDSVTLYNDFIQFIDARLSPQSIIEIDIYEIRHFHDSLEEFFDYIDETIEEVESGRTGTTGLICEDDAIGDGTGFACVEAFEKLDSYQHAMKNRK